MTSLNLKKGLNIFETIGKLDIAQSIIIQNEYILGIGWTLYPPLSTSLMSLSPIGVDLIMSGLLLSGISSSLTSLNFFVTIQNMRCYGITLVEISLFGISLGITASILLIVLPVLTGALVMLLTDLHYNTIFFDWLFGGDPVVYQQTTSVLILWSSRSLYINPSIITAHSLSGVPHYSYVPVHGTPSPVR